MFRRQQQNTELAIEMEEYRRNRCFRGAMTAPYAPLGSKLLIIPVSRDDPLPIVTECKKSALFFRRAVHLPSRIFLSDNPTFGRQTE
jgi:hypothetical protein